MKLQIDNLGKVAVTIEESYWDINKPYDKLTIVERAGTGTTFISRKPVPAGTSILNRNYWIKFSKWSDIPYEITQKFGDSDELAISQKTLTNKFSEVENEIQEGDEALDQRLRVVEVHERIMVDGGELEVATAEDLENPQTPRQEAAVPTVRAILDASDDAPHLNSTKRFINSDNLAKMYGYYLDNPEFIYILADDEYHIILGVKTDGDVVFGVTVPSQIKEYIDSRINEILGIGDITEKIDTINEMIAFFDEISHDSTLKELLAASARAVAEEKTRAETVEQRLDEVKANKAEVNAALDKKVDKEEGKSLIDAEYASAKSTTDSPEFLDVALDAEDNVLEGIQVDGTKVIGGDLNVGGSASINGDTKILGNMEISGVSYKVIENPEYLIAWVDVEDKVIFGLKTDGKTYVGDADFLNDIENIKDFLANITDKNIDWDALSSIIAAENPEFIETKTDSEGKLLAGRTPDGAAFENVGFSTPKISIDGHTVENIEDTEGRTEILTDSEDKVISYRDADGVKHEEVGIDTNSVTINHLELTARGMTEFQKALKDSGFQPGGMGDWSDNTDLHIAEPYCAIVNFSGISDMPNAKGINLHGYMQFWDMNGNYFKKEVIMNAQGQSSMAHPKKNVAIDICNNNGWNDDDTFKLQIGSWVPQDSFHLKGYYNDPFRGLCPVAYKWYDQIVRSSGELLDYVWKRALIDFSLTTETSTGIADIEEVKDMYNNGAKCFPDGFPCIVYLNGDFYGIYSWQLKKHRDNYRMSKSNASHIHLDGVIDDVTLFDGNIDWTQFEIRNPKSLITMTGAKYDGDAPVEIIDETSSSYDSSNKNHKNTAKVKHSIESMVAIKTAIADAYNTYLASKKTSADVISFKEVYETYFDVNNLIDYIIFSDVSHNFDGFRKNWQWITYNGTKWYIGVYDCDGVFGGWWEINDYILPPLTTHVTLGTVGQIGAGWIFTPLYDVYQEELENRYSYLRKAAIIDVNNIVNIMVEWLNRIGNKETFDKEWKKWSGYIKNDSIHRMYKWVVKSIENMDAVYNYNV